MKSLFSITLLILLIKSECLQAKDGIQIFHQDNIEVAKLTVKVLTGHFAFPLELITVINQESKCEKNENSILQICIDKSGESEIISIDHYFIQRNFHNFIQRDLKMEINHETNNEM